MKKETPVQKSVGVALTDEQLMQITGGENFSSDDGGKKSVIGRSPGFAPSPLPTQKDDTSSDDLRRHILKYGMPPWWP